TYGGLIKRCVHLVSSHEQRLCFPLDSIRRSNGKYPANSVEVMYPGMHSDVGGGYQRGDQGKGCGQDDSFLLSQVTLHDLYATAFEAGAPLKMPPVSLPKALEGQQWRLMSPDIQEKFVIDVPLVNRFNAWREHTLNLPTPDTPDDLQAADYQPTQAPVCIEVAADAQMAWITGWRINRYALKTLLQTPFYQRATDTQAGPEVRRQARIQRDKDQAAVEARRRKSARLKDYLPEPGIKDFDPDMAQTQLREAAQEFAEDYHKVFRSLNS
ncbi:T6SS phospholipase effector Tle1-like catalytic domain-containing protein, partial [Pantoea phytobeneficialis]